jgi:hypothetical protein
MTPGLKIVAVESQGQKENRVNVILLMRMRRATSRSSVIDTTSPVAIPWEVELALNGTICSREIPNGIYDDGSNKTYRIQKAQKWANAIEHEVLNFQEHILG